MGDQDSVQLLDPHDSIIKIIRDIVRTSDEDDGSLVELCTMDQFAIECEQFGAKIRENRERATEVIDKILSGVSQMYVMLFSASIVTSLVTAWLNRSRMRAMLADTRQSFQKKSNTWKCN